MNAQLLYIIDFYLKRTASGRAHICIHICTVLPATRDLALDAIIPPSAEYIHTSPAGYRRSTVY